MSNLLDGFAGGAYSDYIFQHLNGLEYWTCLMPNKKHKKVTHGQKRKRKMLRRNPSLINSKKYRK